MTKFYALGAAVALVSAPLNAACWSPQETSAAKVRDLQTMLMVAALRCHAAHVDITPEYNAFVTAAEPAIDAANDRIKAHFRAAGGPVLGQRDYDRFTTTLANAYGAGSTTPQDCERAAAVAHAAAAAASAEGLFRLASDTLFGSPVEACAGPVMARAAPRAVPVIMVEALPIELALAAPVPVAFRPADEMKMAAATVAPAPQPAPVELASASATNVLPIATAR